MRPNSKREMTRRRFLEKTAAGGAALGLAGALSGRAQSPARNGIPLRRLGKTGERVTMLGLGGWNMGRIADQATAIAVIHRALDLGINFFDSAWDYQSGESERRLGIGLKGKREDVFLMTKVHARDKAGALEQLHQSLRRLQTDHLDLWQFHSIRGTAEVERIFAEGGALEAAIQARSEGKVRYIGITGHFDPNVHERALDFHEQLDTIQFPVNCVDPSSSLSFVRQVLPEAHRHGLGVLAMKTLAMGRFLEHRVASVEEALRFAWSQPISVLISGCDTPEHVEQNVELARAFRPLEEEGMEKLVARVAAFARPQVEYYKKDTA